MLYQPDKHQRKSIRLPNYDYSSSGAYLVTIIAGYKSSVTKRINQYHQTPNIPVWQRNYYERIIRNDDGLNSVRTYIENNPLNGSMAEEYL